MFSRMKGVVLPTPARWAACALIGAVLFGLGELDGQRRAGQAHIDYVTAQAERAIAITKAQAKVVVQTEIQYRDRIKTVYLKGEVIEKQVPVYVTAVDDAVYGVNAGFVRTYNAAWSGDDPGAAAEFDREPAGISISEIAEADAFNATACRAWREQALAWRSFYGQIKSATDSPH
jgi:hypothetical protein